MKSRQSTNFGRGTRKWTGAGHTVNGDISFWYIIELTVSLARQECRSD